MSNGLLTRAEQAKHRELVTTKILNFLDLETFTTTDVLQNLLGYSTKYGVTKLLKKLADEGLLKNHKIKNLAGRGIELWGITKRGVYAIRDPDEVNENRKYFEPHRVSLLMLPHRVEQQLIRIHIQRLGWVSYPIDHDIWAAKIPDILCTKPDQPDRIIALEIELTIKSTKRYKQIINDYEELKLEKRVHRVVWICADDDMATRLKTIFSDVQLASDLHVFISVDDFKSGTKK